MNLYSSVAQVIILEQIHLDDFFFINISFFNVKKPLDSYSF